MNAAAPPDVGSPVTRRPWLLSVVVPVRGADPVDVAGRLRHLPGGPPHEIILVENGGDEDTWARLERLGRGWDDPATDLVPLRCGPGVGAAYRTGVAATHGDRVLLTVADLPFGTSDLQSVLACRSLPPLAIGSPAHPRSRLRRTVAHQVIATALRAARKALLGLQVGDAGGTFVLEGHLARLLAARTTLLGPGMTTELLALAARTGTVPVELPVARLRSYRASARREAVDALRTMAELVLLRHRLGPGPRPRDTVRRSEPRTAGQSR